MSGETRLRLPVEDAFDALTTATAARRWLGASPRGARLRPGAPVALPDGPEGSVVSVTPAEIVLRLVDGAGAETQVSITFSEATDRQADITVSPEGASEDLRGALAEARSVCSDVLDRRTPRQAVVFIHGIGEQTPGNTIRDFVEGVLGDERYLSKPDRFSDTLELRRLQAWADVDTGRPRTDFYEYYWAHLLRETPKGQVVGWLKKLARRSRRETPPQLHTIWWLTRLVPLTAALLVGALVWIYGLDNVSGAWKKFSSAAPFIALFGAVTGALTRFLTSSAGDAARYLTAKPGNVEVRRAIREGGIELLRRLEATGRYHRIVVVGHSLGSVIAYDVLTHHFTDMNTELDYDAAAATGQPALEQYEKTEGTVRQDLQHDLWKEQRRAGNPWLVTDFVSLGSPLTHALLLMADDHEDLQRRTTTREFPTSPPTPDTDADGKVSDRPFSFPGPSGSRLLHHAAVFGPTRWTNLYFPAKYGLLGDPVGGPVAPAFGPGVRDIAVTRSKGARTPKSHSLYWKPDRAGFAPPAGKAQVRAVQATLHEALGLGSREALGDLAAELPVRSFVPADPGRGF